MWNGQVLEPSGAKHLVERLLSDGSLPKASGVFAREPGQGILPSDRVGRWLLCLVPLEDTMEKSPVWSICWPARVVQDPAKSGRRESLERLGGSPRAQKENSQ